MDNKKLETLITYSCKIDLLKMELILRNKLIDENSSIELLNEKSLKILHLIEDIKLLKKEIDEGDYLNDMRNEIDDLKKDNDYSSSSDAEN